LTSSQHPSRGVGLRTLAIEAIAIAAARRKTSAMAVLIVAVGAFIPLIINGQAQNARSNALDALDRPEQRIITITDTEFAAGGTTLSPAMVLQLSQLSIVDSVLALGTIQDTRPAEGWPSSQRIATVDVLATNHVNPDSCGSVRLPQRATTDSTRTLHLAVEPAYIAVAGRRQAAPLPTPDSNTATRHVCEWLSARQVLVLVDRPTSIDALIDFISSFGGTNLQVSALDDLEQLRRDVSAGLTTSARQLRNLAMIGAGFLVATITFVANATQTKDMARRRALGATRSDIAILILTQVTSAVAGGLVIAIATFTAIASSRGFPQDEALAAAVSITILLTSLMASLPIAAIAATRDPATVLRVP